MKKLLIFALLILPVASFGAASVRVLGAGATTTQGAGTKTTTTGVARVTPAKATAAKPAAASTASTTSRIGTIRTKPKTSTTGTISAGTSTGTTSSGSRFPVITPAHSYKTVNTQQAAGNTGTSVSPTPAAVTDDPRFDMILSGADSAAEIRADWVRRVGEGLVKQREDEGYVFMWVEE